MPDKNFLKKFFLISLLIFSSGLLLFFIFLGVKGSFAADYDSEEEVECVVGEIKTVKVSSATRVAVVDPAIADVEKVEGDEVLLSAKKPGNTNLTIWDKYGERSIQIRVYAEDLDSLKARLQKLLANLPIKNLVFKISKEEGKMILRGEILSDDKKQLDDVLSPFSDRIVNLIKASDETAIVQFDVQILELSKNASEALGITWMQSLQVREEPYSSSGSSSTGGVSTTLNRISSSFIKLWDVAQYSRDALTARLDLLISEGEAKVLSRPKLVCLSGKSADFLVGGEIPIVTTTTSVGGNVSTNVEFRSYGVNLKVKPVVKGDEVDTTINTEVSDVDYGNAVTVGGTRIPAFATRNASTQVYLKDGQTVFLAGLIKKKVSTNIGGIPFLKDVPFLGALFRSKTTSESDTELVISLTPTIVNTASKPNSIGSANLEKVPPVDISVPPASEEESEAYLGSSADTRELAVSNRELFPDTVISYARGVQEKIAQAVTYPEEAKKYKWQGMVRLALRLLYDGSLMDAFVKESSGYDILDENALFAAKKQAPYLTFPSDITAQELLLDVPVVYKLEPQR